MEEDGDMKPVPGPSTAGSSSGRGRGKRRRQRGRPSNSEYERRRTSERSSRCVNKFKPEEQWSLTEKSRLLEALRRYQPYNVTNITKMVGTRTEEEIEERIHKLTGSESCKGKFERMQGSSDERAPLEAWIDLVQEMTNYEAADYSQFIPKILGLITRNEKFEESGVPRLRWRNIYQFLTDLAEDKAELHALTDTESLVVLDMMQNLGETLYESDTSEQRRILDFKYQLLNFRMDTPTMKEREIGYNRIAQALRNDFWEPEEMPGRLASTALPTSSATSSSGAPSTSQQGEATTVTSTLSSLNESSANDISSHVNIGESQSSHGNCLTTPLQSQGSLPDGAPQGPSTSTNLAATTNEIGDSEAPSGMDQFSVSSSNESSDSRATNGITEPASSEALSGMDLQSQTAKSKLAQKNFSRPLFYTLNPLCVPTQVLAFKPKQ